MNKFQERIDTLSNDELIEIIKAKDDYQEEFWQLSVENASKRGLSSEINVIVDEIEEEKRKKEELEASLKVALYGI